MKENLTSKSNSLIESVQNEILEKWSELELNSESESVFLYEEDHHSISASAIEIHKDNIFWINPTSKKNKISLKFGSSKYHIRVPMKFLDLEISINQLEKLDNQIKIVSTKKERQILSDIKSGFNKKENISQIDRMLISQGIIINSIERFCKKMNVTSIQFQIDKKETHFIDSTDRVIYLGITKCLGDIFGIETEMVQRIIEG